MPKVLLEHGKVKNPYPNVDSHRLVVVIVVVVVVVVVVVIIYVLAAWNA